MMDLLLVSVLKNYEHLSTQLLRVYAHKSPPQNKGLLNHDHYGFCMIQGYNFLGPSTS